MYRRWIGGLIALACLVPGGAWAVPPSGDPVADRFSFPVGSSPNSPTTSRYQGPNGRSFFGWAVHPAASFLSPGFGRELQPGEDWGGRGGGDSDLGQPVYAAAAGTIVAAGYYGNGWGHIVLIRHTLPDGQIILTQYAYLADIVKTAGTVEWRELIGHIGRGGGGSVLHFEVRQQNMLEYPADYWPTADNKDAAWVREHYYSPTQFIRTHYKILPPVAAAPPPGETGETPGEPGTPGNDPVPGGGTPGSGDPGTPGGSTPPPVTPGPAPPPPAPVWDGVQHLDGSLLKSAAGVYYLLHSGKKWRILSDDVLATWARPEEALPATDAELASYPEGSHPLGLREGVLFRSGPGPVCISGDPFDPQSLACWVIENDDVFAYKGFARTAVKPVSSQTVGLYVRPTLLSRNTALPRGTLVKQPYGGYSILGDRLSGLPAVHSVHSHNALRSWRIDESSAITLWGDDFWGRTIHLDPLGFRPGTILRSASGQLYVVSGDYKHLVPNLAVFQLRGYNQANAIPATDAELALHKDWPTPLR